ncbi:MAG: 2Fe-2S iron-sulfur cluster binding domain-containing protein [Telmatospirillum sp.]|nr:2Fe-2S iron-sulfur cluster binding domain-containing protein [Telmatospirillum sp.]
MRNTITTHINGRDITLSDVPPDRMALDWMRAEGLTSVKEGCGEGDCGACTIALGIPAGDHLEWRAVASCLLFLPMLDGRAVLSAEGLASPAGTPHPVQQAMAERSGTQCGFCSPGITMSLFALSRRTERDEESVLDALAGNLCRCTGYRPILEAAGTLPLSVPTESETALAGRLAGLSATPLFYSYGGRSYYAPTDLAEALAYRAAHPEAWVIAGGTDMGLAITKRDQHPDSVLSLARVGELTRLTRHAGGLTIGAAVPYTDILAAVRDRNPALARLLRRVGATQIRNQGTFGGNLGTASPIGDSLPALIALGATIDLVAPDGVRSVAAETFVTGYRQTRLAPDELVGAVHLPDPPPGARFYAYKIAKRQDQDISTLSASFLISVENGMVTGFTAAFGGAADRPIRARSLEKALMGRPWTLDSIREAGAALADDISPRSDVRGSARYRTELASGLLARLWHETRTAGGIPATLDMV